MPGLPPFHLSKEGHQMPAPLTIARRTLLVGWVALIGLVLAIVLSTHVAGALGYRVVIITGSSMAPAIPLGALVFEQAEPATQLAVGDSVTLALPHGSIVTHRVTRTVTMDGKVWLEAKGDANAEPDVALYPASAVTGVVRFHIPLAGFALAFLGIPSGILSVVSMMGSLLAARWLLEEVDADRRERVPAASRDLTGHGLPA